MEEPDITLAGVCMKIAELESRLEDLFSRHRCFYIDPIDFSENTPREAVTDFAGNPDDLITFHEISIAELNSSLGEYMLHRAMAVCDIINVQSEMQRKWKFMPGLQERYEDEIKFARDLVFEANETCEDAIKKHSIAGGMHVEQLTSLTSLQDRVWQAFNRIQRDGPSVNRVDLGYKSEIEKLFEFRTLYAHNGLKSLECTLDYVENIMQATAALFEHEGYCGICLRWMKDTGANLSGARYDLAVMRRFANHIYEMCPHDFENRHPRATRIVPAPLIFDY